MEQQDKNEAPGRILDELQSAEAAQQPATSAATAPGAEAFPAGEAAPGDQVDDLLEVIRSSRDPGRRKAALARLEALGLVERAGDAPARITTGPRAPVPLVEAAGGAVASPGKKSRTWVYVIAVVASLTLVGLAASLLARDASRCEPVLGVKDAKYYEHAASCYDGSGDYEKSIAAAERGLALEPGGYLLKMDLAYASYRAGKELAEAGKNDQAIPYYDRAIEAYPFKPNARDFYSARGWAYYNMNDFDRALADYLQAIEMDPSNSGDPNMVAWILVHYMDTDYERALPYALRSVELKSARHNQDTLGLVYYKLGRYPEALQAYDEAIRLGGVYSYKPRGDVYLAMRDFDRARHDYQEYLKQNPRASDRDEVQALLDSLK